MPKISVIIPVYNNERYLAEAIGSVLAQTRAGCEVIVIDDGSTDGSRAVIESFAHAYPGVVRGIAQENRGPGAARNTGIRAARGEYVAFLDADDAWVPEKLARQAAVLDTRPEIGLVYSDYYYINKSSVVIVPGHSRRNPLPRGRVTLDFFYHYFMFTSTVMARKSCLDRCGYFREDILVGEDYDYFLRLSTLCGAEGIEEKLLAKRRRRESLSSVDALLNAKNDLMILRGFLRNNPAFLDANRRIITAELGKRSFALGYRLLRNGSRFPAMKYLLSALRYRPSAKAVKCLAQTAVPARFMASVKGRFGRREPDAAPQSESAE